MKRKFTTFIQYLYILNKIPDKFSYFFLTLPKKESRTSVVDIFKENQLP